MRICIEKKERIKCVIFLVDFLILAGTMHTILWRRSKAKCGKMRKIGTRFSIMFFIDFTFRMCVSFFFSSSSAVFFSSYCERTYSVDSHNAYLANTFYFSAAVHNKNISNSGVLFFFSFPLVEGDSYFHCAFCPMVAFICMHFEHFPTARTRFFLPLRWIGACT